MLYALAHAGQACPIRAVHVCHNLHPHALQWAAHCRRFSAQLGLEFECLDVAVQPAGEGIEAAARHARYTAFAGALGSGEVLAVAQHADDQAETFLLQALRGAGVAGLAAMPECAAFARGRLWRPWLALPRSVIQDYARAHALESVADPSNHDTGLDRGYLREALWPILERRWPAAGRTLSRAARWCAEASALVDEVAAEDAGHLIDAEQHLEVAGLRRLSGVRQAGVLRHWLRVGGHDVPDHRHVAEIQRLLSAREHAGPVVAWGNTQVRLFDRRLYAMRPLPQPPAGWQAHWRLRDPLPLPDGCGRLRAVFAGEPSAEVSVAFRQGGERYVDARRGGTRKLKALLHERRIAPWWRSRLPLIFFNGRLVAVADYWLDPALAAELGLTSLRIVWRHADR